MKTVEECSEEYAKVLSMFKRSCCAADLTASARSSIEECIMGLKEVVINEDGKCGLKVCSIEHSSLFNAEDFVKLWFSLINVIHFHSKCIDDGGYSKFVILEDVVEDVPGPVNKILRLFHTKVGTSA